MRCQIDVAEGLVASGRVSRDVGAPAAAVQRMGSCASVKVPGSWTASYHRTHDLQRAAVAVYVSRGLGQQLSGMRARHTRLEVIWIAQLER